MTGRPTTYTQEIQIKAEYYLDKGWEEIGHAMPSVVGLCQIINRSRSTVYGWCENKDHPFSDMLDRINEKQQQVLLDRGLKNEYNAAITKLALAKHGFHDKQSTEISGPNGGAIQVEEVKRTIVDPQHSDS